MRTRLAFAVVLFITALTVTFGVVRDAPRPGPTRDVLLHECPVVDRDQEATIALDGYRILANNYVDSPQPQPLLAAGWNASLTFARNAGVNVASMPTAPPADEASFRVCLGALIDAASERIPAPDLARAAISGMARSLNDDHTVFIPPARWKTVESGHDVTVGLNYMRDAKGYLVWEAIPDLPAARAGIRPGDLITSIGGKSVLPGATPRPDAPADGKAATYKIERAGVTLEINVTPETTRMLTTHAELLHGDIAYLRVYSFFTQPGGNFSRDYIRELDKQIEVLKAARPAGWLLDMRNNPGGNEALAAYLALRLGVVGPLVENRERGGKITYITSAGSNVTDGKPVAVVINEGSASSAEIVAAALQDSHVAKVYGVKTPGVVNTSRYFPVAGGGLQITVARPYAGPAKRLIDKVGVTPDESVALDTSATMAGAWSDAQLDRAIVYLRSEALVSAAR